MDRWFLQSSILLKVRFGIIFSFLVFFFPFFFFCFSFVYMKKFRKRIIANIFRLYRVGWYPKQIWWSYFVSLALKCIEQENVKVNDAKLEKELNSTDEDAFNQELPEFLKNVKQKCTCPCNAAPHLPVCGKTTNGLMKTFNSQCHLICHNQCGSSESNFYKIYLKHFFFFYRGRMNDFLNIFK